VVRQDVDYLSLSNQCLNVLQLSVNLFEGFKFGSEDCTAEALKCVQKPGVLEEEVKAWKLLFKDLGNLGAARLTWLVATVVTVATFTAEEITTVFATVTIDVATVSTTVNIPPNTTVITPVFTTVSALGKRRQDKPYAAENAAQHRVYKLYNKRNAWSAWAVKRKTFS